MVANNQPLIDTAMRHLLSGVPLTAEEENALPILAPSPFPDELLGAEFGGARRSSGWHAVEQRHIVRYPTCAGCGRNRLLNVHHVKPFHLFPELELVEANLITLCVAGPGINCHLALGHVGDWKCWNPKVRADAARHLVTVGHKKMASHKGHEGHEAGLMMPAVSILADLPDDLAEAFEAFKLSIRRHKLAGWTEITRRVVESALLYLQRLTTVADD